MVAARQQGRLRIGALMKARAFTIAAASVVALFAFPTSASAACGRMDIGVGSDPYLDYYYDSTRVRVIPHGNTSGIRAAKSRYVGGVVRTYYGSYVWNPIFSGSTSSRVTASDGSNIGSYYDLPDTNPLRLYRQYDYCAINSY